MSRYEKKDTLFIGNLIPDITEDTLRTFFAPFGTVLSSVIPRDRNSGKPKNYGFLMFSSEEEAQKTFENCEMVSPRINDVPVTVSWAYGNKIDKVASPSKYSRSRSPRKHSSDHRSKSGGLARQLDELQRDKDGLQEDYMRAEKRLKECKLENEGMRRELEEIRSHATVILPCGHSKQVSVTDKFLLHDLYGEAISILNTKEKNNEVIVRGVKERVLYIMEEKHPEIYRCREKVRILIGNCGHFSEMSCWENREYMRNGAVPRCEELVEKPLPCGHTETGLCYKKFELALCKLC